MSAATQWTPPASVPSDAWNDNEIALKAQSSFLWALGVLVGSGLAVGGLTSTQALGVLVSWTGFLIAMALAIIAIAQGGIGVSHAAKLEGYRRGPATTGLLGGIGVLVAAPDAIR
ncbi:hypothetical protein [Compostimonas suwonensis]|uniref:Uncharacterized protein n=1 Tax=Compostimonas suwonensis TaxID=1048394 RepID=A0A2M9BYS7_9MICO|nr:hypothetical protein [Compostimonas suwonensis]PJJ63220.1 hypothetical protein CLV54_0877 [Compostimonas suwonensis]